MASDGGSGMVDGYKFGVEAVFCRRRWWLISGSNAMSVSINICSSASLVVPLYFNSSVGVIVFPSAGGVIDFSANVLFLPSVGGVVDLFSSTGVILFPSAGGIVVFSAGV